MKEKTIVTAEDEGEELNAIITVISNVIIIP